MVPIRNGISENITNTSTSTISDLGIVGGAGFYAIFLFSQSSADDIGSAYLVRLTGGSYYRTVIVEGDHSRAPRIDANGVLKINTATNPYNVHWSTIQLG